MKKTILILANSDSGLYDFRKELLKRLIAEQYRVIVSVPEGNYRSRIEAIGCEYRNTPVDRRGINPVKDMSLFVGYWKLLREYQPDVVLTYTIKPNIYGSIACRMRRIPYLVNITGLGTALENPGLIQKIIKILYRIALKRASCVFFQNEQNQKFLKETKCVAGKTKLLPGSGINTNEFMYIPYPSEEDGIRILAVMRIMKNKGIEELLAAVPVIHKAFPHVTFEIAGYYEEESRAEYEPVIKDLQEKGILRYYGYREDIRDIMGKSHIITNPSYNEGMSNVLLEAAAIGRAIVTTDISGCRETMIAGETGVLCKVKNKESLIQALQKVLSLSKESRAEMGLKGSNYVKRNFDRENVVESYLTEIEKAT